MVSKLRKANDQFSTRSFIVHGNFYTLKGRLHRRLLEIRHENSILGEPDLLVIMMNPGGSRPLNKICQPNQLVLATPDRTQLKIMRVMHICNFSYCRVINLADISEIVSGEFYPTVQKTLSSNRYSIFCASRADELAGVLSTKTPILAAWGVENVLRTLAEPALQFVKENSTYYFGDKKIGEEWQYYHPRKRKTRFTTNYVPWIDRVLLSFQESQRKVTNGTVT